MGWLPFNVRFMYYSWYSPYAVPLYGGYSGPWQWRNPPGSQRLQRESEKGQSGGRWWPAQLTSRWGQARARPHTSSTAMPYRTQGEEAHESELVLDKHIPNKEGKITLPSKPTLNVTVTVHCNAYKKLSVILYVRYIFVMPLWYIHRTFSAPS